jgi:hypothetical protein
MTRRFVSIIGGASAVVAGGILCLLLSSHDSEVLLASTASLTPEWKEIRPRSSMRTSGDVSELFIEMVIVHEGPDGTYTFKDGSRISVEGYLVSDSGEKLDLDVDVSVGGFGLTKVLRLSNPALEWKRHNYRFQSLVLRANGSLRVGRIVWISYDPQSTKTGTKIPDAFLKD